MYRLFRFIFLGRWELPPECSHDWKTIKSHGTVTAVDNVWHSTTYEQKCTKCGEMRSKTLT